MLAIMPEKLKGNRLLAECQSINTYHINKLIALFCRCVFTIYNFLGVTFMHMYVRAQTNLDYQGSSIN